VLKQGDDAMKSIDFKAGFDGTTAGFLAKIAELCPRDLSTTDMDRLVREGQLRTLLSTLSHHYELHDVLKVINGEAEIMTSPTFSVESRGKTGRDWLDFFEGKVSKRAKEVLFSEDFKPTNGVIYNLQHAPGKMRNGGGRSPTGVRLAGGKIIPRNTSLELSCLIREQMSEDDFRKLGYERGLIGIHRCMPESRHSSFRKNGHWLIAKWPSKDNELCLSSHEVGDSHSLIGGAGFIFCTDIFK
jgi:hypothetical protein